jgi:hypothetical protein
VSRLQIVIHGGSRPAHRRRFETPERHLTLEARSKEVLVS